MTYLIQYLPPRKGFAWDATAAEQAVVNKHAAYLSDLHAKGRVLLAGRTEDGEFGIALLDTTDEDEARRILTSDPAVQAGVFRADLYPFRRSIG